MALSLIACGSEAESNLPAGWEGAELVEDFSQRPCGGKTLDDEVVVEFAAMAGERSLAATWDHAHFSCEQDVEAYARRGSGAIDLLVQPIDMHPDAIAGCDCLYDISMQVPAKRGDYKLTLYRRWANQNTPPTQIADADVSVE